MTESKSADDRRAQHVALIGCLIQLAGLLLLIGIASWSKSSMLAAVARIMAVGIPIWFVLYLVLNQIRRVGLEALETEELRRAKQSGTDVALFEFDEDALLLEQNRFQWMVRWLLGACTIFLALLLVIGHFVFWGWSLNQTFDPQAFTQTQKPFMMMWFVIGIGFACFLYARYALALAQLAHWGLLRAGAVAMAGSALACVLAAIALMASNTIPWAEPLISYGFRLALLLLGIEFGINFILDLYRPRVPGEIPRPSFDSRLLGMIAEPGGIAKSIADAVNYQFGFQVSSTWFYQLLQRWLFPLTVVSFLGIILLSSVVVVDADEEAVIERWGRLREDRGIIQPGICLKWPFPKDILYRSPVKRVSEMVIGEATDDTTHEHEAVIWTKSHNDIAELMLLVATPERRNTAETGPTSSHTDSAQSTESVAVSLLMVSVPIEYRIKNLTDYLYHYDHPEKLLEDVAYQYLSDYAARVDVDQLMGPGRKTFNEELKRRIQTRLDELGAGIEIVFAGVRGAHPTSQQNVAGAFERVVAAQTEMGAMIHKARGEAQKTLTSAVGSVTRAMALDEAIQERNRLTVGTPEYHKAQQRVQQWLMGDPDQGITPVSGQAARLIAEARASASRTITGALSKVREFGAQVAAYRAAPSLYKQRQFLKTYEDIGHTRKYMIVGDRSSVIVEYETAKEAALDQVLSDKATSSKP